MSDVIPQSENYKEGEPKSEITEKPLVNAPINLNTTLLDKLGIHYQNHVASDTLLFPDRFSPKTLNKLLYSNDNESIVFTKYNFKDSATTFNVFINWMNCFGHSCKSIRIGENKNLQKDGFLMMVNDTSIVFITANSSSEKKKWRNYFTDKKDIRWHYILEQNKHGKVVWQSYENNTSTVVPAINRIE